MSQDLEKIKDRVAKLLRMANDASSPNEAAIAAQRARSLMDKHQLDEYEIGNRVVEEFDCQPGTRFYAAFPQYMSIFAVSVAKYNDCQARFENGEVTYKKKAGEAYIDGKRIIFQGYKTDVQLCIQMYEMLNDTVNRLCKEYMSSIGMTSYSVRIGTQFKIGAFTAISEKFRAITVERDKLMTSSSGNSLVVIKSAAVAEKFGDVKYAASKTRQVQDNSEADARLNGRIKGAAIEITKSVEA